MQYNVIPYNAIQCNTMQYNVIPYNAIQCNTMQYNTIPYNAIQYGFSQEAPEQGREVSVSCCP